MRLFVAIELDERVKDELITKQGRLAEFDRTVRWPRPEQMHLTMKFLGEVPDDDVEAVCAAAGQVAAQVPPFEMRLGRCGCFPPQGRVRIVHVGLEEESGALQRCRDLCEEAFHDLGFAKERRPFTPHLTLGRVREDRTDGRLRQAVQGLSCGTVVQSVEALDVVESLLLPAGAQYTSLAQHRLAGVG